MNHNVKVVGIGIFLASTVILALFYIPWRVEVDRLNLSTSIAVYRKNLGDDFLMVGKDLVFAQKISDVPPGAKIVVPMSRDRKTLLEFLEYVKEKNDAKLGILEFAPNEKILKRVALLYKPERIVRIHMVESDELIKYTPESLKNRLIRAVRERSVEVIVIPPIPRDWNMSYKTFVMDVYYEILKFASYTRDPAFYTFTSPVFVITIAWIGILGIFATISPVLFLVAAVLVLIPNEWTWSLTITAATIVLYIALKNQKTFWRYVAYFPLAFLVNACFALPQYVAGIEEFRGVKLSLALLPAFVAIEGFLQHGPKKLRKSDLNLVILLVVAGVYYLMRTGNYGLVTGWEKELRDLMDLVFEARPRFKELLGAATCVVLSAYPEIPSKFRWGFISEVLLSVGMVSIVNTFCHFKTPLALHLLRAFNGLWLGGLVGLVISGVIFPWMRKKRK